MSNPSLEPGDASGGFATGVRPGGAAATKVFVVEDDPDWATLVRGVLEGGGYDVESFTAPAELLARGPLPERGCLVLDVNLPGMTGLDLQRELRGRGLRLPVILMTAYGQVGIAVAAMREGAFDFLEKPLVLEDVVARVGEALAVHDRREEQVSRAARASARIGTLTQREHEVLELLVAGLANKQIAARLELSVKTVELHRGNVMQKSGAGSLAELVRMALDAGIGRDS